MITIIIDGYLDGVPVAGRELTEPSRWEVQEAEKVTLVFGRRNSSTTSTLSSLRIDLVQLPRQLSSSKVGVGAVLWDGGIVLAALLASCLPLDGASLFGETVVELGAGVGAPSLVAATRGARVVATDREEAVSGVLRRNAMPLLSDSCKLPPDPRKVSLCVLEFGTPEGDAAAAALADAICSSSASVGGGGHGGCGGGVDLVLAADCVYVDGASTEKTPDPRGLCRAAARLLLRPLEHPDDGDDDDGRETRRSRRRRYRCPPSSRAWVAAELRDAETHALFYEAAEEHFESVRRLQLPAEVFGGGGGEGGGERSGEGGESRGWGHVRVFELAGARAEAAFTSESVDENVVTSPVALSAAETRALKKPRKRGWP